MKKSAIAGILAIAAITAITAITIITTSIFTTKIGHVNSQEIFERYSGTKTMQEELIIGKEKLEREIQKKREEVQKVQVELQEKGDGITDKEREEYEYQVNVYQKFINDAQTELNRVRQEKVNSISKTIDISIESVAKREKYDYILEVGAVKFGVDNLTDEVLKMMEN